MKCVAASGSYSIYAIKCNEMQSYGDGQPTLGCIKVRLAQETGD